MIPVESPSTPEAKAKAVDAAVKDIEKEFGKGSLLRLGEQVNRDMPCIPTGVFGIDYGVLGIGGFPKGRIVELIGAESGGKTSLALQTVAQAQQMGLLAAYIDTEHALSPPWMETLGVDVNALLVSQPSYAEEAMRIVERLVDSSAFGIIVLDSVAALCPRAEMEGEIGDAHVGLLARLMAQSLRMLTGRIAKSETLLVFINQLRMQIGQTYGDPTTTPGGRALKFFASQRLSITRVGGVKKGEEVVGNQTKVKALKNKVAPPFKQVEVDLLYDRGFDGVGSLIDVAVDVGVLGKSSSWYNYNGEKFQGKDAAREFFGDRERYSELLGKVLSA